MANDDKSNGYEEIAEAFIRARNQRIGGTTVREWSKTLSPGCPILDLGCGYGAPISQVLADEGFSLYGVDASATLLAAFRQRFPDAHAQCSPVEESDFFGRTFDAIIAWGLLFLLPAELQTIVLGRVAKALNPGGRFLFTASREVVRWNDSLTGRESVSLGAGAYANILAAEGLEVIGNASDEGENYYYFVVKLCREDPKPATIDLVPHKT
jgi:2-polyprenyl-3-methyl-5-hydroxy-6-metoxy-1,4-benzoquinol methylase